MARLVVIAPGRGSYNRTELNYLQRFDDHPRFNQRQELLAKADDLRAQQGRPTISELDGADQYRSSLHLPGENASALILTAAAADFALIDPAHEVCAVLGNSMGWYITLYTGGALSFEDAFHVVDTMGWYQKGNVQGGQLIYPVVDEQWRPDPEREATAFAAAERVAAQGEDHWVGLSIRLGGQLVFAGTDKGIRALLAELPKHKLGSYEYPFQLARHSAFHTHLMRAASDHGLAEAGQVNWRQPNTTMIDGNGRQWKPHRTPANALRDYTFIDQVIRPYDFTASVRVALREYNPDALVLLGPGETLGGAIAQVMIAEGWRGMRQRADFIAAQKSDHPPLISMNRPEQAAHILS